MPFSPLLYTNLYTVSQMQRVLSYPKIFLYAIPFFFKFLKNNFYLEEIQKDLPSFGSLPKCLQGIRQGEAEVRSQALNPTVPMDSKLSDP